MAKCRQASYVANPQNLHMKSTHLSPGPNQDYHELSLWTPLHQAAYMRAPVGVISQLVEYGAFRTVYPVSFFDCNELAC